MLALLQILFALTVFSAGHPDAAVVSVNDLRYTPDCATSTYAPSFIDGGSVVIERGPIAGTYGIKRVTDAKGRLSFVTRVNAADVGEVAGPDARRVDYTYVGERLTEVVVTVGTTTKYDPPDQKGRPTKQTETWTDSADQDADSYKYTTTFNCLSDLCADPHRLRAGLDARFGQRGRGGSQHKDRLCWEAPSALLNGVGHSLELGPRSTNSGAGARAPGVLRRTKLLQTAVSLKWRVTDGER